MDRKEIERERRRQRALERMGTNDPRCGTCGEGRWQCLEEHHPAGRKHDPDTTVFECRNCHRVLSDDQLDQSAFHPDADALLAAIGHFLLGLADMLRIVIARLYEYGEAIIERSVATGARQ